MNSNGSISVIATWQKATWKKFKNSKFSIKTCKLLQLDDKFLLKLKLFLSKKNVMTLKRIKLWSFQVLLSLIEAFYLHELIHPTWNCLSYKFHNFKLDQLLPLKFYKLESFIKYYSSIYQTQYKNHWTMPLKSQSVPRINQQHRITLSPIKKSKKKKVL